MYISVFCVLDFKIYLSPLPAWSNSWRLGSSSLRWTWNKRFSFGADMGWVTWGADMASVKCEQTWGDLVTGQSLSEDFQMNAVIFAKNYQIHASFDEVSKDQTQGVYTKVKKEISLWKRHLSFKRNIKEMSRIFMRLFRRWTISRWQNKLHLYFLQG